MEPRDRKGSGDASAAKGKKTANARKRTPKSVKSAEQNGAAATERELAPPAPVEAATGQSDAADRNDAVAAGVASATEQERADRGDGDQRSFGERDADRAADQAADIKSWMDARREDRDAPREVL